VLVSSHILTELEEIADRVVLVSRGRTIGEHAVADLIAAARTPYRVRAMNPQALTDALRQRGIAYSTAAGCVELPELGEADAADLLADLVGAGVRVVAFEPVGSSLESVYLVTTEERL